MNLFEREPYLDILKRLMADLQAQPEGGHIVFVSGEAGIGKTSLVRHFTRQVDAPVLWGMCDPLSTPRPLAPLMDVLEQMGTDLLAAFKDTGDRFALFSGFLHRLKRGKDAWIVVFEDVHWADSATRDLIVFLGRRISQTNALLILTYRDDEVTTSHPLQSVVGDLARVKSVQRVKLPGLSLEAVELLTAGTALQAEVVHRITNGTPFFVTELLAEGEDGQIPSTIREAVLARKSRLPLPAQSVLEAAAVIGTRSEPWLLKEVSGAQAGVIEACLASGIVQTQDEMTMFRHELSRQTILEAIPPHRKQALHQAALAALEDASPANLTAGRLANHAEGAGDSDKLKKYALAAAKEANAAGAFHIVREQYRRVLERGPSPGSEEKADLLERYAEACRSTAHIDSAIAACEEALVIWRNADNRLREGRCLTELASHYFYNGQTEAADRASHSAIEILEPLGASQALASAYAAEAFQRMLNRDIQEAIQWGHKALDTAQQFGDAAVTSYALNVIGAATLFLDYERGCEFLKQSLDVANRSGDALRVASAYANLASGSGELYRFAEAARYADEGRLFTAEHDLDNPYQYLTAWQALNCLYLGKWSAASECAWEVLESSNVSTPSRIMALLALGRFRTRRGDPGASDTLDEALELALPTGHLQRIAPVRAARAELAWYQGNHNDLVAEAQANYDMALQYDHPWFAGELAFWLWRGGRLHEVPAAVAEPFAAQIAGDAARAADLWQQHGCPYEEAIALSDSAEEDDLLRAIEALIELEAQPAIAMVQQKLRQMGSSKIPRGPRKSTRTNPAGLTNREFEILELVAEDLTNSQIADRLFISPKTVENHVTTILSKLNVQSRQDAAAFAHRHNLFTPK